MSMTPHRIAGTLMVLAIAATAGPVLAADFASQPKPGRLFHIVNASFDSVTAVAVSGATATGATGTDGSNAGYESIDLREPLQGGLTSTSVRLPDGACLRDVKVTFRGGRSQVYRDIDVCKANGLRLSASRLPAAH
jgi:hypothetical protein